MEGAAQRQLFVVESIAVDAELAAALAPPEEDDRPAGLDELERREPNGDLTQTYGCIKGTDRVDDLSAGSYVSVSFIKGGAAIVDQFASEPASVSVTGYGDKAVYVPDAGAMSIAVGADSYQIQVVKGGRPSDQADATAVADDVLG